MNLTSLRVRPLWQPRRKEEMAKAAGSKKPKTTRKVSSRISRRGPTEEEIRTRAYEIYLRRGGAHGHDLDDWFRAEREFNVVEMK
jgi:hypothetical protein